MNGLNISVSCQTEMPWSRQNRFDEIFLECNLVCVVFLQTHFPFFRFTVKNVLQWELLLITNCAILPQRWSFRDPSATSVNHFHQFPKFLHLPLLPISWWRKTLWQVVAAAAAAAAKQTKRASKPKLETQRHNDKWRILFWTILLCTAWLATSCGYQKASSSSLQCQLAS